MTILEIILIIYALGLITAFVYEKLSYIPNDGLVTNLIFVVISPVFVAIPAMLIDLLSAARRSYLFFLFRVYIRGDFDDFTKEQIELIESSRVGKRQQNRLNAIRKRLGLKRPHSPLT